MTKTTPDRNKQLVLEAFDTLFNNRDYDAACSFWSERYIQHSAHIEPGREGLFRLIRSLPDTLRYEHDFIVAEGDYVIVHGRFSGTGRPAAWVAADVLRIENGVLAEHWDVLQDEATQAESKSGLPMFGDRFREAKPSPNRIPGAEWIAIVRKNGTKEFAAAFAPNPVLDTSVMNAPMVGIDVIATFFAATAGGMYDSLIFTNETVDGVKTYLEWKGKAFGKDVAGITILTRNDAELIQSIQLHHRPPQVVLEFSKELGRRIGGKFDADLTGTSRTTAPDGLLITLDEDPAKARRSERRCARVKSK